MPPRHDFAIDVLERTVGYIEVHALEFGWPQRAQVLRGVGHGDVERFDATSGIRQERSGHSTAHSSSVTIAPQPPHGNRSPVCV